MQSSRSKEIIECVFASPLAIGMSHIMGRLARAPVPRAILEPFISIYCAGFKVDREEAEVPAGGFSSFSDFFGRRLASGSRPIAEGENAFICPCDGELVAMGEMAGDEEAVFAIKQNRYSLGSLLGNASESNLYAGGQFAVLYLHPRDYHRIHVPTRLTMTGSRHVPGARYPVASWCEKLVDNIYEKNERVVFSAVLPNGGRLALVMVAAFGVGNIDTEFGPGFDHTKNVCWQRDFDPPVPVERGAELGAFLLGSTVVMIWSRGAVEWSDDTALGPIKMGRLLGKVLASDVSRP